MKRTRTLYLTVIVLFFCFCMFGPSVRAPLAQSFNTELLREFPKERYIVGIGEVKKTDNLPRDKKIAGVYARADIARQIKVRIKEKALDIRCEGGGAQLYEDSEECKNEFRMIIEESVDEVLVGSRIVKCEVHDEMVYAIAVLPKRQMAQTLGRNMEEAINKAKESMEKVKKGDMDSLDEAQKEFMKASVYDQEREILEGVKKSASAAFEDLEKEIVKMKENISREKDRNSGVK